eukprot:TRINITY_DN5670_c0_g1_i1.p1 TRINITY_DN5670_c0_g1~~TRINITY_DN5670_c0_g1_i1.p1  ORF type:complete len:228 (+),score=12.90 TRINITY_DN5670_c0_g1_i1:75-758(+)
MFASQRMFSSSLVASPCRVSFKLARGGVGVLLERIASPSHVRISGNGLLADACSRTWKRSMSSLTNSLQTRRPSLLLTPSFLTTPLYHNYTHPTSSLRLCKHYFASNQEPPSSERKSNEEPAIVRERVTTIPNLISLTRIAVCPYIGLLIAQHSYETAFYLCLAAGASDVLDGFIARRFPSQRSMFGTFLDPFSDKVLITTLTISLAYSGLLPSTFTSPISLSTLNN